LKENLWPLLGATLSDMISGAGFFTTKDAKDTKVRLFLCVEKLLRPFVSFAVFCC
jgi:hypothetical protein